MGEGEDDSGAGADEEVVRGGEQGGDSEASCLVLTDDRVVACRGNITSRPQALKLSI